MKASERQVGGSHYRDMPIQPSEFITRNRLSWNVGNAVKYLCRHSAKGGAVDLEKAIHYIELEMEQCYGTPPDDIGNRADLPPRATSPLLARTPSQITEAEGGNPYTSTYHAGKPGC